MISNHREYVIVSVLNIFSSRSRVVQALCLGSLTMMGCHSPSSPSASSPRVTRESCPAAVLNPSDDAIRSFYQQYETSEDPRFQPLEGF
ncbi:hypothetical protein Isop_1208 [Isosphaera pallida ATCC 43644]|uniref:Uncharacterized protein n=1 Tax=Isosphaera pallida (strain ATCC 43644 / DSM 9630 / IS1B) TaxID=575540 RepID=E8R5P5_ISOPI|nr:hypothetical protein Isop_1208 [Isosphaera pallida ATCC 43644]